jgi:hypothetical protein
MIADAAGSMPEPLRNEADWRLFQAALDRACVVVVGSLGHRRHPNPGRRRLVFTSTVPAIAADPADPLAILFNPAGASLAEALSFGDIPRGVVAVTGGKRVFDHFLHLFDRFALAEVDGFVLPGGIPCFTKGHPRNMLAAAGLLPKERQVIDPAAAVSLTRWALSSQVREETE